ncbi:AMP deaminase [Blomia tropicalis]|nr:AMP deaminase [Blomia tropicalis]
MEDQCIMHQSVTKSIDFSSIMIGNRSIPINGLKNENNVIDISDDSSNGSLEEPQRSLSPSSEIYFFEGAEKRLAVFMSTNSSPSSILSGVQQPPDLRKITTDQWAALLSAVECRILSTISTSSGNSGLNAYLLSESSMFVARDHLMIKTCGNTKLLNCLDQIGLYGRAAGFDQIASIRYSRKNLIAPELQEPLYQRFEYERDFMNTVLERNGAVHCFGGKANNSEDRFFLYTSSVAGGQHQHQYHQPKHFQSKCIDDAKQEMKSTMEQYKFEIIMEQLDPSAMAIFMENNNEKLNASEVTARSGIGQLLPGMMIDDHLFEPCGYSMNGLIGQQYMTIHITPEPDFSYVSLETDVPQVNYPDFIAKILRLFRPQKFMLNIIVPISAVQVAGDLFDAQFHGFVRLEMERTIIDNSTEMVFARYGTQHCCC